MEAKTLKDLSALRETIKNDPRVKALDDAEKALKEDTTLAPLLQEKEEAEAAYLLSRVEEGEESEATKRCLKRLHEAKLALDLHPSAREYSSHYAEVNALYRLIDDILFGDIRERPRCGGKHD